MEEEMKKEISKEHKEYLELLINDLIDSLSKGEFNKRLRNQINYRTQRLEKMGYDVDNYKLDNFQILQEQAIKLIGRMRIYRI